MTINVDREYLETVIMSATTYHAWHYYTWKKALREVPYNELNTLTNVLLANHPDTPPRMFLAISKEAGAMANDVREFYTAYTDYEIECIRTLRELFAA